MEITKLNSILINHKNWLKEEAEGVRADLSGAILSGANLSGAILSRAILSGTDLSGTILSRADLSGAILSGANLSGAILSRADLSGAVLSGTDLSGTILSRADLSGAILSGAILSRADLSRANLSRADLSGANLSGAVLSGAILSGTDLYGADLSGADLSGADLSGAVGISKQILNRFYPLVCPEEGSFIGWKKVKNDYIVKLKIMENAKRSSAFGRKCRCSEALVLAIENWDGTPAGIEEAQSKFDPLFKYHVGEIVKVPNFDDVRANECAPGIHFFITRQEAVNYR